MKKYYIGVQVEEDGKYYAYAIIATTSDNLLSKLSVKNIITANIFNSRKEARAVCGMWNKGFKENGKYLFDD